MKKEKKLIDLEDIEYLEIEYENNVKSEKKLPVDNKELYKEFVIYKQMCKDAEAEGKERPQLTDPICIAIMKIAELTTYINTNKYHFLSYTNNWKEEMVGDAVEICIRYVHNFNPDEYKNPFSYIQSLCINAFLQRIRKEHQQLYYRYKLYQKANGFVGEIDQGVSEKDIAEIQTHYADDIANDFIKRFEEKRKAEKEKYRSRNVSKKIKPNSLNKFMDEDDE